MAKGQVRGNKEVRKPKAEKAKPPVSVGTSLVHSGSREEIGPPASRASHSATPAATPSAA